MSVPPACRAYELVDFGHGRKLERYGAWLLDRPSPGADAPPANRAAWAAATARFDGARAGAGAWSPPPAAWDPPEVDLTFAAASHPPFSLTLAPLPSGHIGAFPEQQDCWNWIAECTRRALADRPDEPPQVLNLFAYTGGSTLAAAAAGAAVCHVDAARSVVARARRNAERSRCADRPIRWLVEDALRFCQRELKRGRTYDALVLDPPTFGRGPDGQSWSLDRDLPELLAACGRLVAGRLQFVLLTCHTPGYGPQELAEALGAEALAKVRGGALEQGDLNLATPGGRRLASGSFARWRA